ncbi:MAG TPA: hypothetical protein VGK45_00240, partial [Thermoanaerobaculia bacterium]
MDRFEDELDRTLTMLSNRIAPNRRSPQGAAGRKKFAEPSKLVVLLGAGCSRQYGLPSFLDLLTYLWEDFHGTPPPSEWPLEILRNVLDGYWRPLGPADRKSILEFYLKGAHGA